jgi:hypothetical protein
MNIHSNGYIKIRMSCSYILWLGCSLIYMGCEKEIQLDLPDYERKLVVEGWIEQNKPAKILLSYNAPYFTTIDSENIRDYAATRAKITIAFDDMTEVLTLKPNDVYFPPYFYFTTELYGEIGGEYMLTIENEGKVYHASTTIPEIVYPDSVWFSLGPGEDSLGMVCIRIVDNPLKDNYYRVLVKRLGQDVRFIPASTSVFDDKLFSGQTLTLSLYRGSGNLLEITDSKYFRLGDTIVVRFCSIDFDHYQFWHSLQNSIITSANPFATDESGVISNIDGALGVWGGYGVAYDTVVAK